MATYILVHGAWHGGWCYRETAAALRGQGHQVFTPTLSGVGERFHQSRESITLETHVRDLAGVVEAEELDDIILVGHSYGGMVITCLADRMPERIRSLVYLDAFVPEQGQSLIHLLDIALAPEVAAQFKLGFRGTAAEGNCGLMQPIPAEIFNIAERNRAWVNRRRRPQALATFEMPALLSGGVEQGRPTPLHPCRRLGPQPVPALRSQVRRRTRLESHQDAGQPRRDGRHAD